MEITYFKDFDGSMSTMIKSSIKDGLLSLRTSSDGEDDLFIFADLDINEEAKTVNIKSSYRYGFGTALKPVYEESYNYIDDFEFDIIKKMCAEKGYMVLNDPKFYSSDHWRVIEPSEELCARWRLYKDICDGEDAYENSCALLPFEKS